MEKKSIALMSMVAVGLIACGKPMQGLETQASKAVDELTCKNAESGLFDVAQAAFNDLQTIPQKQELVDLFSRVLEKKKISVSPDLALKMVEDFYEIVLNQTAPDLQAMKKKVAEAEIGVQEDAEGEQVQRDLKELKIRWAKVLAENGAKCGAPETPSTQTSRLGGTLVSGANKTLGIAYQSCDAIRKPAMTSATSDTLGIKIVGEHPDGGKQRVIDNLPLFLKTNYYLNDFRLGANCRDVRKSPLIYDFGGKPDAPSVGNTIDLFTNAGDGTSVLGIDCSGYVFTSLAAAGLKLDPDKKLKPTLAQWIYAALYREPSKNGMPCFEKINVGSTGSIKAGDVAASTSHIVIVESVGTDPLGIEKATTEAQCNALTYKNFNFVVAQSSPSKGGIGINKYVAKDYLPESSKMKIGFEKYAREACKARLKNSNIILSGQEVQLIRHKGTAACTNDTPIQLVGDACVSSCASASKEQSSFQ